MPHNLFSGQHRTLTLGSCPLAFEKQEEKKADEICHGKRCLAGQEV